MIDADVGSSTDEVVTCGKVVAFGINTVVVISGNDAVVTSGNDTVVTSGNDTVVSFGNDGAVVSATDSVVASGVVVWDVVVDQFSSKLTRYLIQLGKIPEFGIHLP